MSFNTPTTGNASSITGLIEAGTNIVVTGTGTEADPYVISTTGVGPGIAYETPVGTIDSSNTTFTVVEEPVFLSRDGTNIFPTTNYTLIPIMGGYQIDITDGTPPQISLIAIYNL